MTILLVKKRHFKDWAQALKIRINHNHVYLCNQYIGTNTIAVMSGTESYHPLKNNLRDSWAEINEVIADGAIEIKPGQTVPVEMFLGGDYKVRE